MRRLIAAVALMSAACANTPAAPGAPPNIGPRVSIVFDGPSSCAPPAGGSCAVQLVATATDPDGDPLTYRWSGCASGTAPRATCTIDRVGPVVASVEVSDGNGHTLTVSTNAEGLANRPPVVAVQFDRGRTCVPLFARPCTLDITATATDADGDALTFQWSGCASGTTSRAACRIDRVGPATASVEVSDGQGHTVSASIVGEGLPDNNTRPAVTLAFEGASACTPLPKKPCTVTVVASASDPDGDPLSYRWSGCASGSGSRVTCTVDRPGSLTALVEVSDDRGEPVTASIAATGTNQLPFVHRGALGFLSPITRTIEFLSNVQDPDEGPLCGRDYCAGATTAGPCSMLVFSCTCLAGLEIQIRPTAPSGACTLTIDVKDGWGAVGSTVLRFDVSNLAILMGVQK